MRRSCAGPGAGAVRSSEQKISAPFPSDLLGGRTSYKQTRTETKNTHTMDSNTTTTPPTTSGRPDETVWLSERTRPHQVGALRARQEAEAGARRAFLKRAAKQAWVDLREKGYAVVPGVLSESNVTQLRGMFFDWFRQVFGDGPVDLARIGPHNIFKYHRVGQTAFMWYVRHLVADFWGELWGQKAAEDRGEDPDAAAPADVVTAFDGCCWMPKDCRRRDNCWTHTDQPVSRVGFHEVQGIATLTSNKRRGFVVYPGSHRHHQAYGKTLAPKERKSSFLRIKPEFLERLRREHGIVRTVVEVQAGDLVLWDSQTFHQNCYGPAGCEERLGLYTSFLPTSVKANTPAQQAKRVKYLDDRTTSHRVAPIRVNSKQPQTYGNDELLIDYDNLPKPKHVVSRRRRLALIGAPPGTE